MKSLITREGFERLKRGHPWLFKRHLLKGFKLPERPCVMPLGEHWFFVSPKSEIVLRRLGPATRYWPDGEENRILIETPSSFEQKFSKPLIDLFSRSYSIKKKLLNSEGCFRWLFAENDFIPGLVVDVFEKDAVAQIQSAPVEFFWPVLRKILLEVAPHITLYEQRNLSVRKLEGLILTAALSANHSQMVGAQSGCQFEWNGLKWFMNPGSTQKTGAYLDQRNNHKRAVYWAKQLELKNAWDLFCFEGGFGLHLAQEKISVLGVDQSSAALKVAEKNALLNNIEKKYYQIQKADVFSFLTERFRERAKTDMVVLDPPSFAKKYSEKTRALKGLKELNLRAFHCLKEGGLLVSCSCSHHISQRDFYEMLQNAAHDARRAIHVLEVLGPSPDHAPLISFPEGDYFQAWFLLVN